MASKCSELHFSPILTDTSQASIVGRRSQLVVSDLAHPLLSIYDKSRCSPWENSSIYPVNILMQTNDIHEQNRLFEY